MVVRSDFWKGRPVFLTGHTGFKGSWLSLWLQNLGAEVVGYALPPPTRPNLFEIAHVAHGMSSLFADIRDLLALKQAMRKAAPEIVFHMAAQPLVRFSYEDPVATYATNVMGTVHLLEAVRQTPSVKAVVVVTTDKCYENKESFWGYRENDPLGGYDPYSSSKACAELVSAAYRSSFFNPLQGPCAAIATARAGNVIGGGDWGKDRLIPDLLRALEKGGVAQIRNPNAIRPWQHVLEPLRGYLMLAEKLYCEGRRFAEAWNFGPREGDSQCVGWVCNQLCALWEKGASWQAQSSSHLHEAHYLKLDSTKANDKLGWKPALTLKMALHNVVEWHQSFLAKADMRAETLKQIQNYQESIDQGEEAHGYRNQFV